jgi:hypothetical protein
MSRGRESFQKRLREKARRDKVQAKRDRRESRAAEPAPTDGDADAPEEAPAVAPEPEVLAELAELHARFDADRIDFDEFEQRKSELLAQLDV